MPIKNTDIILFQSQDNTDNDNGGGARTNNVVEDGAVNNLFPDISRVDTVAGDVAMRKVFPVVNTDSREIYYGAHAMIRKTPDDERVSALLFYTDDAVDTRVQAQADVESYLVPSFQTPFYLFGSNIEGAKAVTFLQRLEEDIPLVGEVFLLREESNEQYFRVSNVEDKEVILFFDGKRPLVPFFTFGKDPQNIILCCRSSYLKQTSRTTVRIGGRVQTAAALQLTQGVEHHLGVDCSAAITPIVDGTLQLRRN